MANVKDEKPRLGRIVRSGRVAAVLMSMGLATTAMGETGTWTGGAGGVWDTSDSNWSGLTPGTPWDIANGPANTAVFNTVGDSALLGATVYPGVINFNESATISGPGSFGFGTPTSTMTIDVATGETADIGAGFVSTANTAGHGNRIAKTGAGTLVISGTAKLVGDFDAAQTAAVTVEGGGELQVTGYVQAANDLWQGSNRSNGETEVGTTSANNTLTVSGGGRLDIGGLWIGENAFGGNSVDVTAPGSLASPSLLMKGNGKQVHVGTSSSNNSLTVSNGAYFFQAGGSGTVTWFMGTNAGANNNSITVTGAGSTIDMSSNHAINVGGAGDGNSVTVSAGGYLQVRKLLIGQNGGDNNTLLVTGANSSLEMSAANNVIFEVGSASGSVGNSATISAGATALYNESSGTGRAFAIGKTSGADDNYLLITGNNSVFTVSHVQPIAIGGQTVSNAVTDSTASGNHIDIFSGGSLQIAATTSAYVMGVNSAINLGDGTGVSQLNVGNSGGVFAAGVFLKNADGRLNIDSGRLTANAAGALVSGLGEVVLNGPAYVSTGFSSTISTLISGAGSLVKEGDGILELTQLNTYTGTTRVADGTLKIDQAFLADAAGVFIDVGAMMDLAFAGIDTVKTLQLGGVNQLPGTYGATGSGATFINDTYFSGAGVLNVTNIVGGIPTPAALPAGVALLAVAGMRRTRNRREPRG